MVASASRSQDGGALAEALGTRNNFKLVTTCSKGSVSEDEDFLIPLQIQFQLSSSCFYHFFLNYIHKIKSGAMEGATAPEAVGGVRADGGAPAFPQLTSLLLKRMRYRNS
ncbi:hypothetical protein Y1Q_0010918 [Alligator mississippiensis]|uniref:Uncharacterized protein n=1 Tax=Alligator mississippiensis TaxID=8496 RepID=A0A151MUS5_ALLMI|nr:hypothetical protein Y1Q_0010918 [Alligator mississippiensis]